MRRALAEHMALGLIAAAIAAVGIILAFQALVMKPYGIPSESMAPTLEPGEGILANRLAYRFGDPDVGDVAVFYPPAGAMLNEPACGAERSRRISRRQPCPEPTPERGDSAYVKRIVAGPGDRVSIEDGVPVVNGDRAEETFRTVPCRRPSLCEMPLEIVVPDDHWFVMGDHRGGSIDSRHWGPVPREWMIAEAFLAYWPPGRFGGI